MKLQLEEVSRSSPKRRLDLQTDEIQRKQKDHEDRISRIEKILFSERTREIGKGTTGLLGQRIMELASEGFLANPRSDKDVMKELENRGYHYPRGSVATELLRIVRRGSLRRFQGTKQGHQQYFYTNP